MKIRNVSGQSRNIPALSLTVEAGDTFEVDDTALGLGLLAQPSLWAPVGADTKKLLEKHTASDAAEDAGASNQQGE